MSRLLFENSNMALGFAGVIVGGAAVFALFSGSLDTALSERGEQEAPADDAPVVAEKPAVTTPQPEIADFAPDEELIDNTNGFDPTPGETVEIIQPNAEPGDPGPPPEGFESTAPRSSSARNNGARANAAPVRRLPTAPRPQGLKTAEPPSRSRGNGP